MKLMPILDCDCTEVWQGYEPGHDLSAGVYCSRHWRDCEVRHPIAPEAELPHRGSEDFTGEIDGAGYKASMDDPSKPPMDLVPTELKRAVARVMGKGAKKYARGNWMRGMSFSEVIAAGQRHIDSWQDGETSDPATGENHLAHAACCLAFLLHYQGSPRADEYARFDDRLLGRVPAET
jgi:hypothetical protein